VLLFSAQGMSPPPPVSVTFPLTVIPFSLTVSGPVAVTFPLTLTVVVPSGSLVHGCSAWPIVGGGFG
jgi:hypothetical protein